jgi:hypothetical protein
MRTANYDSQQQLQQETKSHSRSSSPKSFSVKGHSSEKSKRAKYEEQSVKPPYEKITMSGLNGARDDYRSRGDRSDRSDRSDKFDAGSKEKKEQRKREHSMDEHAADSERKRSKSDEAKKEKKLSQASSQSSSQSSNDSSRKRSSKSKHEAGGKEEGGQVNVSASNGRDSSAAGGKHRTEDGRRVDELRKR